MEVALAGTLHGRVFGATFRGVCLQLQNLLELFLYCHVFIYHLEKAMMRSRHLDIRSPSTEVPHPRCLLE